MGMSFIWLGVGGCDLHGMDVGEFGCVWVSVTFFGWVGVGRFG